MSPTPIPIVRRRVNIEFDSGNERAWLALNNGIEDFLNTMSYYFAPAETFFIQSVQHYQDRIIDPALKIEVGNFIYQEAMHTKQHNKCNHAMAHAHPHGPRITKFVGSLFGVMRRFSPKSTQLAFTAALEHFYAILSDFLLIYQKEFIRISDPSFSTLWLWHAVEETEHKAVCFDVYHHIHGKGPLSYLNRVFAMLLGTLFFAFTLPIALWWIKKDVAIKQPAPVVNWSQVATPETIEKFERYGFWGFLKQTFPLKAYFSYYKPSFHPWEHDNAHLIAVWKQQFPDLVINDK
jgi:predicted metal-dependent hydrolase